PPFLLRPHPRATLLPYTTLFRSIRDGSSNASSTASAASPSDAAPGRACCLAISCQQTTVTRRWSQLSPGRAPTTSWSTARSSHRSEQHTSELQSPDHLVCRLLLE